jgi:hypothetical protein
VQVVRVGIGVGRRLRFAVPVTSAYKQNNSKSTCSAGRANGNFYHLQLTILQDKLIFAGVTTYYAGIRRKSEENRNIFLC